MLQEVTSPRSHKIARTTAMVEGDASHYGRIRNPSPLVSAIVPFAAEMLCALEYIRPELFTVGFTACRSSVILFKRAPINRP